MDSGTQEPFLSTPQDTVRKLRLEDVIDSFALFNAGGSMTTSEQKGLTIKSDGNANISTLKKGSKKREKPFTVIGQTKTQFEAQLKKDSGSHWKKRPRRIDAELSESEFSIPKRARTVNTDGGIDYGSAVDVGSSGSEDSDVIREARKLLEKMSNSLDQLDLEKRHLRVKQQKLLTQERCAVALERCATALETLEQRSSEFLGRNSASDVFSRLEK